MKRSTLTLLVLTSITLLATGSGAQTYTTLHEFEKNSGAPTGVLVEGIDGNIYGVSPLHGAFNQGTVFRVSPKGVLKVIQHFNGVDGKEPFGGLTLGTDGSLYGTTAYGGVSRHGEVFKITPEGQFAVISGLGGNAEPYAPPIQGRDGNLYGTASGNGADAGWVYKVTQSGMLSTLYGFDFVHGAFPTSALVLGIDGNFYGTTERLGANEGGTLFKITPEGRRTILRNFVRGGGGHGPLYRGSDGNTYGMMSEGGTGGAPSFYRVETDGTLTILHDLELVSPGTLLVLGGDGNFYAIGTGDESCGCAGLVRINLLGESSVVYDFDGTTAPALFIQSTDGSFYGSTGDGFNGGLGEFIKLDLNFPKFLNVIHHSGKVGKSVSIVGQDFTSATNVSLDGSSMPFTVLSDTFLEATVPNGAHTGFITAKTSDGNFKSNFRFQVVPDITGLDPSNGPVGTAVEIIGVSLDQAKSVTFGSAKATFSVVSDSKITTTVPPGAETGLARVTTDGGTASSSFEVTQ